MKGILLAGLLVAVTPISAWSADDRTETGRPDLPALATVIEVMAGHPAVDAARANVRAQKAASTVLRTGPYEYNVRLEGAQRREPSIDARYHDWSAVLERPLRLPAKARLDERLGEEGVGQAELAVGDALHEAGRSLLRLWFAWMRAAAVEAVWQSQLTVLDKQRELVARRVKLGDAPRQEQLLADASLAQADYSRLQARARAQSVIAELRQTFPGILPPASPVLPPLRPVEHDLDYWRTAYLTHNHELGLATSEVRRRTLIASRSRADSVPDPTVGIRYTSERSSIDRIVGLFVSVPLPGGVRQARINETSAQIDVASGREATLVRRLSSEISALYTTAQAAYESAGRAVDASMGMVRNAELSTTAYSLGEANLSDVLLARRMAIDADLAATLARLEAAESRYRLLLDAHELWPLD